MERQTRAFSLHMNTLLFKQATYLLVWYYTVLPSHTTLDLCQLLVHVRSQVNCDCPEGMGVRVYVSKKRRMKILRMRVLNCGGSSRACDQQVRSPMCPVEISRVSPNNMCPIHRTDLRMEFYYLEENVSNKFITQGNRKRKME